MASQKILMVDDEPSWVELVFFWLQRAGYSWMTSAATGAEGLEKAVSESPDCILLDLVLPDQSGIEVCRKLRSLPASSRVPIVLFTAHKKDRVEGLESGADYFLGKTGEPVELLATLDAIFRRRRSEIGLLTQGELVLRTQEHSVQWKGVSLGVLSPKMFTLFHVLVERSPQPVSRGDLFRLVEGGSEPGLSRALDILLNRLRKSLPAELSSRIVSVKNFGYLFLDGTPAE